MSHAPATQHVGQEGAPATQHVGQGGAERRGFKMDENCAAGSRRDNEMYKSTGF